MKPLLRSFLMLLRQITRDSMLYAICAAPLLAAGVFRFGIPFVENLLCGYFGKTVILSPYYLLIDLFLAIMTPYMFCFVSAMVILTEMDENLAAYMAVTPVGKRGYIISRLVFPAIVSFFVSLVLMRFFALSAWSAAGMVSACLLGGLIGIPIALLIVSFSHNRVEGMALAKLAGILLLGLPVPFFLFSGVQYAFFMLPTFWMAKLFADGRAVLILPAVFTGLMWTAALYRRFTGKLS